MLATILALIGKFLDALNITFPKYFPPKSTEQKVEEGASKIDDQIKNEEESGRPSQ